MSMPKWARGFKAYPTEVKAIVSKGIEQGLDYTSIAKKLNDAGLRTKTGKSWGNSMVSGVAIANGVRRKFRYGKPGNDNKKNNDVDLLETMEDIVTSTLSSDTKRTLLKVLCKDL